MNQKIITNKISRASVCPLLFAAAFHAVQNTMIHWPWTLTELFSGVLIWMFKSLSGISLGSELLRTVIILELIFLTEGTQGT